MKRLSVIGDWLSVIGDWLLVFSVQVWVIYDQLGLFNISCESDLYLSLITDFLITDLPITHPQPITHHRSTHHPLLFTFRTVPSTFH